MFMELLISLFLIRLFVYTNSLYYSIFLIAFCLLILSYLVLMFSINILICFIFLIVYLGAMIVIIGYICCVTPNINLEPDYNWFYMIFLSFTVLVRPMYRFLVFPFYGTSLQQAILIYSFDMVLVFFTIVTILFLTLLGVRTPPSSPQGPFRSL